jgi:hypothetical protein
MVVSPPPEASRFVLNVLFLGELEQDAITMA